MNGNMWILSDIDTFILVYINITHPFLGRRIMYPFGSDNSEKMISFFMVLIFLVMSGEASRANLKHLDKTDLLKEILARFFVSKGIVIVNYSS